MATQARPAISPVRFLLAFLAFGTGCLAAADQPQYSAELLQPLEALHNHGSCIVETKDGGLLACWFNGSGERQADDVKIVGARLAAGAPAWSERFAMADTVDLPDTNPCMTVDPQGRLWLFWITIQDNHWESSLLKYKRTSDWQTEGPPRWQFQDVLHIKPGPAFAAQVAAGVDRFRSHAAQEPKIQAYIDYAVSAAQDKLKSRLGWMTRAHPFILDDRRLIVPLYSDGFNFALMAITDDWGETWHTSAPLVGEGNVQPCIVRRHDGSLFTMMRDNGLPPQRIQQASSLDGGETWSTVTDSELPDPGAGLELITLQNGHWLLVNNDTEKGRHRLAVRLSADEGKTWPWLRHLEADAPGPGAGSFSYPSVLQARDGTLHVTYSFAIAAERATKDAHGRPKRESIKHAHFNEAWVMAGDAAR